MKKHTIIFHFKVNDRLISGRFSKCGARDVLLVQVKNEKKNKKRKEKNERKNAMRSGSYSREFPREDSKENFCQ